MKRKYCFLALFILFSSSYLVAQTTINGKILGGDGKPMPLAHIHYYDKEEITKQVNPDGSFSITANGDYLNLMATGVNHNPKNITIPLEKDKNVNFELYLKPIQIDTDKFKIIGSFNNFSFEEGDLPLPIKGKDMKYSINLPPKGDTLFYQILMGEGENARSFNGTQASFYVYDGGGDYRSGIIRKKKDKDFAITFDPQVFKNIQVPDKYFFSETPGLSEYVELINKADALKSRMNRAVMADVNSNGNNAKRIKEAFIDTMITDVIDKASTDKLKDELIINAVNSVYFLGSNHEIKNEKLNDLIRNLIKRTPATSDFWSKHPYSAVNAIELTADPDKSLYIKSLIEQHPDTAVKQIAIYNIIDHAARVKDEKVLRKYLDIMFNQYPNSTYTRNLKREYTDKVVVAGNTVPQFKIANLDNPSEIISPDKLKGKYVMIDFWGTWCGPCLGEMPYLDSAYKKFKDRNFNILSMAIDKSPENITQFRSGKWKMPWTHAFIPKGWDDEICDIFKITAVPTCMLINPEGKIVAVEGDLRGDRLLKTLDNTLPPPPPTIYEQVR